MRKISGIVAGVITGFVIIYIGDATVHSMHPMPLGLNYMDKNVVLDYIATIPKYVMVTLAFFWILSSFMGGLVTGLIVKEEWKSASLITGGILLVPALFNLIRTAPMHPGWMWITAIVGFLPAALFGAWMMRRSKPDPTIK